jgi:propanediol dehydratase small subunit
VAVELDPVTDYPLGSRRPELVTTPSGLALDAVTLEAARDGTLSAADTRATSATLALQADVARAAGRAQLADGLVRASELAGVPDEELLAIYTALRPGRSSAAELEAWATRLDDLGAVQTAAFVREAASVYVERGLVSDG